MTADLEKATELLHSEGYTCVLQYGDSVFTSTMRGVKPLVAWLHGNKDFHGFSAADRVIGKATAFLYTLLGVKAVYADVISRSALEILTKYQIAIRYGTLTEYIINRQGDGICPFEAAVLTTDDPQEAYCIVCEKMQEMNIAI